MDILEKTSTTMACASPLDFLESEKALNETIFRLENRIHASLRVFDNFELLNNTKELNALLPYSGITAGKDESVIPLVGFEDERGEILQFLRGIVDESESNSLLITGSRGSGKSALLYSAIQQLIEEKKCDYLSSRVSSTMTPSKFDRYGIMKNFRDHSQAEQTSLPLRIVYIDGNSITDDVSALKMISRQLALDVSDESALVSSVKGKADHSFDAIGFSQLSKYSKSANVSSAETSPCSAEKVVPARSSSLLTSRISMENAITNTPALFPSVGIYASDLKKSEPPSSHPPEHDVALRLKEESDDLNDIDRLIVPNSVQLAAAAATSLRPGIAGAVKLSQEVGASLYHDPVDVSVASLPLSISPGKESKEFSEEDLMWSHLIPFSDATSVVSTHLGTTATGFGFLPVSVESATTVSSSNSAFKGLHNRFLKEVGPPVDPRLVQSILSDGGARGGNKGSLVMGPTAAVPVSSPPPASSDPSENSIASRRRSVRGSGGSGGGIASSAIVLLDNGEVALKETPKKKKLLLAGDSAIPVSENLFATVSQPSPFKSPRKRTPRAQSTQGKGKEDSNAHRLDSQTAAEAIKRGSSILRRTLSSGTAGPAQIKISADLSLEVSAEDSLNLAGEALSVQLHSPVPAVSGDSSFVHFESPSLATTTTITSNTLSNGTAKPQGKLIGKTVQNTSLQEKQPYEHHLEFLVNALRTSRGIMKNNSSSTSISTADGTGSSNAPDKGIPVVIVIDEFEAFAKKTRQTFLYSLLDFTHSAAVHLAVIGISSRMDIVDFLEKRLRSRFSSQQVILPPLRPAHVRRLLYHCFSLPSTVRSAFPSFATRWDAAVCTTLESAPVVDIAARACANGKSATFYLSWASLALSQLRAPAFTRGVDLSLPSPALLQATAQGFQLTRALPYLSSFSSLSVPETLLLMCLCRCWVRSAAKDAGHGTVGEDDGMDKVASTSSALSKGGRMKKELSLSNNLVNSADSAISFAAAFEELKTFFRQRISSQFLLESGISELGKDKLFARRKFLNLTKESNFLTDSDEVKEIEYLSSSFGEIGNNGAQTAFERGLQFTEDTDTKGNMLERKRKKKSVIPSSIFNNSGLNEEQASDNDDLVESKEEKAEEPEKKSGKRIRSSVSSSISNDLGQNVNDSGMNDLQKRARMHMLALSAAERARRATAAAAVSSESHSISSANTQHTIEQLAGLSPFNVSEITALRAFERLVYMGIIRLSPFGVNTNTGNGPAAYVGGRSMGVVFEYEGGRSGSGSIMDGNKVNQAIAAIWSGIDLVTFKDTLKWLNVQFPVSPQIIMDQLIQTDSFKQLPLDMSRWLTKVNSTSTD